MMEGGIRKILTENVQNRASRIFGKITLNPLQFRKASSSPSDRTETNFIAPVRDPTLDSLKRLCIRFPHISSTDKEVSGH